MAEAQRTRFDELMDEGRAEERIQANREMLHRQAATLFDTETTEQFAQHLDAINDSERLAELSEFIVVCKTAEELLAHARSMDRNA